MKEEVYGALDSFIAWELEFPLITVKKAIKTLEHEKEWKRIIQVWFICWCVCVCAYNTQYLVCFYLKWISQILYWIIGHKVDVKQGSGENNG